MRFLSIKTQRMPISVYLHVSAIIDDDWCLSVDAEAARVQQHTQFFRVAVR